MNGLLQSELLKTTKLYIKLIKDSEDKGLIFLFLMKYTVVKVSTYYTKCLCMEIHLKSRHTFVFINTEDQA